MAVASSTPTLPIPSRIRPRSPTWCRCFRLSLSLRAENDHVGDFGSAPAPFKAAAEAHSDATVFSLHPAVQKAQRQNLETIEGERNAERRIDINNRAVKI